MTIFVTDYSLEKIVVHIPTKDMPIEEILERINDFDKEYFLKLSVRIFSKICVVSRFCRSLDETEKVVTQ